MYKLATFICTSLCAFSLASMQADDVGFIPEQELSSLSSSLDSMLSSQLDAQDTVPVLNNAADQPTLVTERPAEEAGAATSSELTAPMQESVEAQVVAQPTKPAAKTAPKKAFKETSVKAFTGKVKGKKVRMRLQADTDSSIVKELNKGELLSVVGEKGDFWAVQSPSAVKAYVFRSYVLENKIEGQHVNIRLAPSVDAPVLTHLNSGDKVLGTICSSNNKWMEIAVPSQVHFYVAKSYVENIGAPEIKAQHEAKRQTAAQFLESAQYLSQLEFAKSFPDIDFEKVAHNYQTVINDYPEFSDLAEQAKEELAHLQESYIDKRISYMETKPSVDEESVSDEKKAVAHAESVTDKMKLWEPIEEAIYLSWSSANENRSVNEYYVDQKNGAVAVTGIVEPYTDPVKCKPGDFIVRDKDLPVAYVYSTQINLQNLVGKRVTLLGSPRPNNNFAFPAYFVLSAE